MMKKNAKTIIKRKTKKGGSIKISHTKTIKKSLINIKSTVFYKAVKHIFIIIAEINKWTKKDALLAVDDYFNLVQKIHKKKGTNSSANSVTKGGANNLGRFMRWMCAGTAHSVRRGIHLAVGTFDTPCNILLSLIAIGTWSVFAYNYLNNVSDEEARHSMAQPVQYIIYNQYPGLYNLEESINNILIEYTENISQRIPIRDIPYVDSAKVINSLRTFFWEGALYRNALAIPIACLLVPFIESCRQNCPLVAGA